MRAFLILLTFILLPAIGCSGEMTEPKVITGAGRMSEYMPLISGKTIALVANQTL